jgi:hypothetical protein
MTGVFSATTTRSSGSWATVSPVVRYHRAAQDFPAAGGAGYDLLAFFDCPHAMGDPVGALRHAANRLAANGSVLLVEPMAGEHVEDNLNPVARVYSGASVLACTPNALASGGTALGTLASEASLAAVAGEAGLSRFRRATETAFNRVFEAKH